jgi:hypothetical protein
MTESNVTFGRISKDEWVQPASIDEARATEARQKLSEISFVPYAGARPARPAHRRPPADRPVQTASRECLIVFVR